MSNIFWKVFDFCKKKVLKPFSTCLQLIFKKLDFVYPFRHQQLPTLLGSTTKVEHSLEIEGLCSSKFCYILSIYVVFSFFFHIATILFPYTKCEALCWNILLSANLLFLKSMLTIILTYSVYSIWFYLVTTLHACIYMFIIIMKAKP